MSVHITVEKQTESFTVKSVVDQSVEGEDAAYTPEVPADPGRAAAKAKDSLNEDATCWT